MAQIVQRLKDSGGTSYIEYYATPSYTRNGSKVTVSIRCSLYGWGYVSWAYLDGVELARQPDSGTVITKTFTYDNAAAKTYSYEMKARLQTAREYESYYYTETVSIDVPAYIPPVNGSSIAGGSTYSLVSGAWKKNDSAYIKVNGVWKESQTFVKNNGVWKPKILYNIGDQCTETTGGWSGTGLPSTYVIGTLGTDRIKMYGTTDKNTGLGTVNKINFAGYSTLIAQINVISTYQTYYPFSIYITEDKSSESGVLINIPTDATLGRKTITVSLSNLTATSGYVCLFTPGTSSYKTDIFNIYLE